MSITVRPIPFTEAMVVALLEGRKTQTRRLLKPQPPRDVATLQGPELYHPAVTNARTGEQEPGAPIWGVYAEEWGTKIKYRPGDLLYVREPWASDAMLEAGGTRYYATDDVHELRKRQPAMFMHRWRSRLTLSVTEVRIQRLQDISEADARAEGIVLLVNDMWHWLRPTLMETVALDALYGSPYGYHTPVGAYDALWTEINGSKGPSSWAQNPWVVAVTFAVQQENVDRILSRGVVAA
jgi:hypothetical protein